MRQVFLFTLIATLLGSCKKDTSDASSMTANLSEYAGTWIPTQMGITPNDSLLKIFGCTSYSDGSVAINHCITLAIKNYSGAATYNLPDIGQTLYSHSVKGYNTDHRIVIGSITVSTDDDYSIDGTFEFKAYNNPIVDTVTINNGVFHIVKNP